jgi:hypothetical protein
MSSHEQHRVLFFRGVAMASIVSFCELAMATGQYRTDVRIDPVLGLPVPPVLYGGGGVGAIKRQEQAERGARSAGRQ